MRELKEHDREYFEKSFSQDITRFISTICKDLRVDNQIFHLILDLQAQENYEQMKELELDQPHLLNKVLTTHFTTEFLLSVLQFTFAFFVRCKNTAE